MSFLLTIQGLLATGLVAGLLLGFAIPARWKLSALVITALAAAFAAVRIVLTNQAATEALDIFFAALWGALGAFPGAAAGSWLRNKLSA